MRFVKLGLAIALGLTLRGPAIVLPVTITVSGPYCSHTAPTRSPARSFFDGRGKPGPSGVLPLHVYLSPERHVAWDAGS
jgi:hypothetical protein